MEWPGKGGNDLRGNGRGGKAPLAHRHMRWIPDLRYTAEEALHRVRGKRVYTLSTPHHSAMNNAVAFVDFRSDSRSTYSLKPCIAAPLAPKHRLGMS